MPLSIQRYYKHYASVSGTLAAIIGGLPLISEFLPYGLSEYAFPPLGRASIPARLFTVILAVGFSLIVFHLKDSPFIQSRRGRRGRIFGSFMVTCCGLVLCFILYHQFAREVPISTPGAQQKVLVSIGYRRTEFTKTQYSDWPDEKILEHAGFTDGDIDRLWTSGSVLMVRLALFLTYGLVLCSSVVLWSLGVLYDALGEAPGP